MEVGDRKKCRDRVVNNEIEKWRQGYKWIENNTEMEGMEHDGWREKQMRKKQRGQVSVSMSPSQIVLLLPLLALSPNGLRYLVLHWWVRRVVDVSPIYKP